MKTYPSIPHLNQIKEKDLKKLGEFIAFDKIDGSQIRVEWNSKQGFYKFGSRTQLLTESQQPIYQSIDIFNRFYKDAMQEKLTSLKIKQAVLFFEFYGPNSFAGGHSLEVPYVLTLIDVAEDKKGLLAPDKFIERYGDLSVVLDDSHFKLYTRTKFESHFNCVAKALYKGKLTDAFIRSVEEGTLPGMWGNEGVVCKTLKNNRIPMFKIKIQNWYDALAIHCAKLGKNFEELK